MVYCLMVVECANLIWGLLGVVSHQCKTGDYRVLNTSTRMQLKDIVGRNVYRAKNSTCAKNHNKIKTLYSNVFIKHIKYKRPTNRCAKPSHHNPAAAMPQLLYTKPCAARQMAISKTRYVTGINVAARPSTIVRASRRQQVIECRKVAVLGAAGGIGQPLSLLLKMNRLVTELALYDIANTPGVAADLSHCNTPVKVCVHGWMATNPKKTLRYPLGDLCVTLFYATTRWQGMLAQSSWQMHSRGVSSLSSLLVCPANPA